MAKKWQFYCDAGNSIHGSMRCSSCHRLITEGEYRVICTWEMGIAQHRACSPDDPEWARRDGLLVKQQVREAELEREAKAFIAKWGYVDLEEYM